jgi:hypothetical protein
MTASSSSTTSALPSLENAGGQTSSECESVQPAAFSAVSANGLMEVSREAKLLAAAILEVLAGSMGPSEAARGLGISLARYYQLEARALAGLVNSCEMRRRGGRRPKNELTALQRECEQLRRECARQQALMRATRRSIGLLRPVASSPKPEGAKKRPRRPAARALKMAALLHDQVGERPRDVSPADTFDAHAGRTPVVKSSS